MVMLDKNMDWATLKGPKEDWAPLHKMARLCMQLHKDRRLPNYENTQNTMPPEGMFPTPDKLEGSLGYMDTQQLMKVGEYTNDTPQAQWVRETHQLDYCHVKMHVQPVGMVVKNHFDSNGSLMRTYTEDVGEPFGTLDVVKVLHFLSDWQMGQVVMIGDQAITDWRAGDAITFPWYMEHATANCNDTHERHLLFIAGIKKQK